jgi:DNA-binding PadR family transcriptional regulator
MSTSPRYAVLGFLYIHPMHGYDLHKHLTADLGEIWHISQSQAYNILKGCEKEGWIIATREPQEKLPDRSMLALTPAGQAEFERWLYIPSPGTARDIRVGFITRLYFASQIDPRAEFAPDPGTGCRRAGTARSPVLADASAAGRADLQSPGIGTAHPSASHGAGLAGGLSYLFSRRYFPLERPSMAEITLPKNTKTGLRIPRYRPAGAHLEADDAAAAGLYCPAGCWRCSCA